VKKRETKSHGNQRPEHDGNDDFYALGLRRPTNLQQTLEGLLRVSVPGGRHGQGGDDSRPNQDPKENLCYTARLTN
jgi:hypothetical protein